MPILALTALSLLLFAPAAHAEDWGSSWGSTENEPAAARQQVSAYDSRHKAVNLDNGRVREARKPSTVSGWDDVPDMWGSKEEAEAKTERASAAAEEGKFKVLPPEEEKPEFY